jgi:hypothetical protein
LERVKGIEPSPDNSQAVENQQTPTDEQRAYTQIRAQIEDSDGRGLAQVVAVWPSLSAPLKAAILAIVNTAINNGSE